MLVDRATLSDLAILDPGEEGTSLFSLLDRTRTRLGSATLKARMRNLPPSADVHGTQDAIRYLSACVAPIQAALDVMDPDVVDEYLSLKWQALTKRSRYGRFVERLTLRMSYGDVVREVSNGVGKLHALLQHLPRLVSDISSGPEILQRYARRLADLIDQRTVAEAHRLAQARSLRDILEADRLARGPAREPIREILSIVAELDALSALASATVEHGWCFPEFVETDGMMSITGLWHALLPTGVPNDVLMDGEQRVLAITGPNMAGKSTLLKATGTAVYLAHLGSGIPATRARMSRFDALLASLYVRDSLSSGRSFYLGEVRRIRDLMTTLESTPRVFALLDEPFKGTNIHDSSDATALLVDGLCAQISSAVMLSTHLASVVQSRSNDKCLSTRYLGAVENESGLTFDYQLRSGVSDQRLGMVLLQREGVAPALSSAIQRRALRTNAT